jgi:hypothetical protein
MLSGSKAQTYYYWRGYVSSYVDVADSQFSKGDYVIIQEAVNQAEGMSGSAVLNGCGYTGMANGAANETLASVIPAHKITQCIERQIHKLPYLYSCPGVTVIEPPKQRFECPYHF